MQNHNSQFKKVFIILVLILILTPVLSLADGFNSSLIITDSRFSNSDAFSSAEAIQRFLKQKGSVLANTSSDFLKQLKEPADVSLKIRLEDPNPDLGRLRSAAELIYDAAQLSKINPQVILVTLQKEQSLIGGSSNNIQRRLDRALGYACPDSGVCGDIFLSFYSQLFGNVDSEGNRYLGGVRSLSKSFYTPSGRGPAVDSSGRTYGSGAKVRISHVGDTITVDNTQGAPYNAEATQTVTLGNSATAALYRYTPHVYNGNYNFWKFFTEWFKFTNGSLVKFSGSNTVYFIDNGTRRPVSGTVMTQRGLDVTQAFEVSSDELTEFPEAPPLPPKNGTLLSPSTADKLYIVADNELREVSDFVSNLQGYDKSKTIYLPLFEVNSYAMGDRELPPSNTLLRGVTNPEVYIVEGGKIRSISGFVFEQRGFKFSNVIVAPDSEVATMSKGQTLPPLDGTLIKQDGQPLVYYVALGQKFPIPYFVFLSRGFKFSKVVILGSDEVGNMETGEHLAPADGSLLKKQGDPTVYFVEQGQLHGITGFLFKHNGLKFSNVLEITEAELTLFPIKDPLVLPDGSLIKVTGSATVYLLEEGIKNALTLEAFNNRNFDFSDVVEVPDEESLRYPSGSLYLK
ncbi:MAG: hypothetical protein COT91_01515 [Candidatus Doudnabacteria bacterium CG10_big_fil_rev_8_21_14_0_10_41_10]|uniref:Uncharacterized protein n=1 Tax=Candidatus Doudnabacteria bacterium CG10_big_fil_rev_8_21_14_0_10_41_10 TaxID=1974551 RepID=A0A2H0VGD4_9BACT|nr:MAG: hypothetical protein COT91_01515 [Candidatus Doudnabacteria bacterium CG10_big_fil_rev_8_21_14_0_10_41_10]